MCTYIYWVWRLFPLFRIQCCSWNGPAAEPCVNICSEPGRDVLFFLFFLLSRVSEFRVFFRGHTRGARTGDQGGSQHSSKTMADEETYLSAAPWGQANRKHWENLGSRWAQPIDSGLEPSHNFNLELSPRNYQLNPSCWIRLCLLHLSSCWVQVQIINEFVFFLIFLWCAES